MNRKIFCVALVLLSALSSPAKAQQPKTYRIGVLLPGGLWYEAIDGLRDGLKKLGFEEGKQYTLAIRDMKGDVKAAAEAARTFEH